MKRLSAPLDLSLVSFDLEKLIENYWIYEKRIQDRAFLLVVEFLAGKKGAVGDEIVVDDDSFTLKPELSLATRTFTIVITPAIATARSKQISEFLQFQGAGFVSKVVVVLPSRLRGRLNRILALLEDGFVNQYNILENAFLEAYAIEQQKLFHGLDAILSTGFSARGAHAARPMTCLTITSVSTRLYSYYLAARQVQSVLTLLKNLKASPFSPLDGMFALLFDQSVDSFIIENVLRHDEFSTLPFSKIFELEGSKKTNFVQNFIFGEDLATLEVCRVGDYSLQICCAPSDTDAVIDVVSYVRKEMVERFRTNLLAYSLRSGKLSLAFKRMSKFHSGIFQGLKEFLATVIAKYLAEMSKP
jgi:hypothetical protein